MVIRLGVLHGLYLLAGVLVTSLVLCFVLLSAGSCA